MDPQFPIVEEPAVDLQQQPVLPVVPVRRRRTSSSPGNVLFLAAAFVAIGGLTFAAGRFTAPTAAASTTGSTSNTGTAGTTGGTGTTGGAVRRGAFGGGLFGAGAGAAGAGGGISVQGTVSAVTADSLTLTLTSGQTVTIPLNSSTTYHQQASGTASDVQAGKQVIVELGSFERGTLGGATAGASPSPGSSPATRTLTFGPARDVTVVGQ